MNNRKIYSIGIIIVALAIGIPTVYSAVEPHIQITMESSQTQNPFVIKDNFGVEVFTIDPSGVITPSQGGDPIDFGVEEVVLDKSANDGESQSTTGFSDPFVYRFLLPTTANLWKITAVEFKIGDEEQGNYCVGVVVNAGDTIEEGDTTFDSPLENFEVYAFSLVSYAKLEDFGGITANTVYKIKVNSIILEGGTPLVAMVANCQSSGAEFSGTSTTTDPVGEFDTRTIIDGSDNTSIGKWANSEAIDVGFNYYMKVYAVPIG